VYKLLLILKYLRKRRIAWVSLVAVTLCTAMVLVVISVMGGWLQMFLKTSQELEGDIIVARTSDTGFGHYQEILERVRKLPEVNGATAAILAYGVANFNGQFQCTVEIRAYSDLDQVGKVNSFFKGLYRQYQQAIAAIDLDASLSADQKARRKAELIAKGPTFDKPLDADEYRAYLPTKNFDASTLPGIIPGTPRILHKEADGSYSRGTGIYADWVKITLGDLGSAESVTPHITTSTYWIVDDCRTNFYPVDRNTVYLPFDKVQQDTGMAESKYQEKINDQLVDRVDPARVSEIQVGVKEPWRSDQDKLAAVNAEIQKIVDDVEAQYDFSGSDPVTAQTWDKQQAQYTSAIRHEEILLIFLFGLVSIVAVFLVFCIFFMIVAEKTRDIGIIKSVGASNWGVAQIFLGYGLSIGLLGGGSGLLLAYLVVHNINEIHAWLGRVLHVVIWDPQTYIFDTIPSTMQAHDVIWVVSIAVLSALGGAILPAIRAARMSPVEALRWE
jgi:lipoprotein-releasing system permease protein